MPLRSIELFAGAGGLAMGFSAEGVEHSAVVEWDKYACDTLRENKRKCVAPICYWPDVFDKDVRMFDYRRHENVDLVTGGPPCQPFSMGGKHRGCLDHRDMFPEAFRAVRATRPRAFVFENVRGLTRPAFFNYFTYILLQLEFPSLQAQPRESWSDHLARLEREKTRGTSSEYHVVARVLNAADFGVPQKRARVLIVGFRAGLNAEWTFPCPTHSQDALLYEQWVSGDYWEWHEVPRCARPRPAPEIRKRIDSLRDSIPSTMLLPWRTVRDAISDLPEPERATTSLSPCSHRFQPGARSYLGHTGSPLDEPAKALKAGDHGVPGGENMLRKVDGSVRYFTVRESARLQTFPDHFIFHGTWTESMRQLGNAVPVTLARAIASSVATCLI